MCIYAWRVCVFYFATFCHPLWASFEPDPHPPKITCAPYRPPLDQSPISDGIPISFFMHPRISCCLSTSQWADFHSRGGVSTAESCYVVPSSDPRKMRSYRQGVGSASPDFFVLVTYGDVSQQMLISLPVISRGRQARPLAPETPLNTQNFFFSGSRSNRGRGGKQWAHGGREVLVWNLNFW